MPREEKRYLNDSEKNDIISAIGVPFDSISDVINCINDGIRENLSYDLNKDKIYPSKIMKLTRCIIAAFESSIISPKFPIGPITADSIGQQQTQAGLNTFHSVGTIKSGGSEGVREAISISANRKNEYAIIHFKNESLVYEDIMKFSKEFLGISIALLSKSIKLKYVNIAKYVNNPYQVNQASQSDQDGQDGDENWWYKYSNFLSNLIPLNPNYPTEKNLFLGDETRACIRIQCDLQKLYEYQITTADIAEIIDRAIIKIDKNNKVNLKCIYSPTIQGIIDVYIFKPDSSYDDYLVSIIQFDEFAKILVSGIPGITNFFAIKKPIISLIRDGENKKNEQGKLCLYLHNNRFVGIPFLRFNKLINAAGYFLDPSMTEAFSVETLYDYNPINPNEMRKTITIVAAGYQHMYTRYITEAAGASVYFTVEEITQEEADYDDKVLPGSHFYRCHLDLPYINSGYCPYPLEFVLNDEFISYPNRPVEIISFSTNPNVPVGYENRDTIVISASKHKPLSPHDFYVVKKLDDNKWKLTLNLEKIYSYGYTSANIDEAIKIEFDGLPGQKWKIIGSTKISLPKYLIIDTTDSYDTFKKKLSNPLMSLITGQIGNNDQILLSFTLDPNDRIDRQNTTNIPLLLSKSGYRSFSEITEVPELSNLINSKSLYYIVTTDSYEQFTGKIGDLRLLQGGLKSDEGLLVTFRKMDNIDIPSMLQNKGYREFNEVDNSTALFENIINHNILILVNTSDTYDVVRKNLTKTEENIFKNYFYAETTGSSLSHILLNERVNNRKTFCNNYHAIANVFGIENLRNFLVYDLKIMINSSAYINGKYLELVSDVLTHTGLNPMTSEGILSHGRGSLAYATFDRVWQHLNKSVLIGKKESTAATSISIMLGEQFRFGTGGFSIRTDKTKIISETPVQTNKTDFNTDYQVQELDTNIHHGTNGAVELNSSINDLLLPIPTITPNKLPTVPWIYEKILVKNSIFYIRKGIEELLQIKPKHTSVELISFSIFQQNILSTKNIPITAYLNDNRPEV